MLCRTNNYLVVFQKWNPILRFAIYQPGSIPGELFVVKKGRARSLFLLSPVSFITPTLHTDISFIYLRCDILVANDCIVHQNAFLSIPSGHTARITDHLVWSSHHIDCTIPIQTTAARRIDGSTS